ncbi:hypothetical protein C8Q77DRAFT_61458 [Trametes polyzona]|nr:hypothetical protein C8Q77DRAFT_61458 [Trametes polyzona]
MHERFDSASFGSQYSTGSSNTASDPRRVSDEVVVNPYSTPVILPGRRPTDSACIHTPVFQPHACSTRLNRRPLHHQVHVQVRTETSDRRP